MKRFAFAGLLFLRCASLIPSQAEVRTGRVQGNDVLEGPAGFQRAMDAFDYRRALDVAQSWAQSEPSSLEAALAVAQASNALADLSTNDAEATGHIERALAVLKSHPLPGGASSIPTQQVGMYHFLSAEALGLRVRSQGTSAIQLLPTIVEESELAVKLTPAFEDGAAQRLLGTLLVKAPAWPQGPGDADRGMKILQDAMEHFPARAEGYIHYADVLLDSSRVQDAQRYLGRAKELVGKSPRARKLWLDVEARLKTNKRVKQYE